jgi:nucleotide-binding universal stress UspA family protein
MAFSSELSLRAAIRARLLASAPLLARLGGSHVYDEAPRNSRPPYIVFTQGEMRDWSTMTETGAEHLVVLEVWSDKPGAREALEIAGAVADLLHDEQLPLAGATCVHARIASVETLRQNANRFVRARLRLRALVETN